MDNACLAPEHQLLREQVARFLAREVQPHSEAWEREGRVPREVLRKLGEAGLLGLAFEPHAGAAAPMPSPTDVSLPKALTGELVNEVTCACQQLHGGMGFMTGTAIERLCRDARVLAVGGGATEVMLDEAAKRY